MRSHIRRLRSRLIDAGAAKDCIANVHGRGYFLKVEGTPDPAKEQAEVIDERQFSRQPTSVTQQYQSFLEETWQQFRPKAEKTLEIIQTTLKSINTESITTPQAEEAHLLTHKLAGTIGLFNQDAAMKSAQTLEVYFEELAEVLKQDTTRSQFEISPSYLTKSERNHHFVILQKALAKLSSPQSSSGMSGLVMLNLNTDLTQAIQAASQTFSLSVQSIQSLEDFPSIQDSQPSMGLLIPLNNELSDLSHITEELAQLKQEHPDLVVIAVGSPITFTTRLQAIRWGVDYILEQHHSPQILLKQVIQLLYPQAHQTQALLIDDDETWLQVMTQRLETFGFNVTASAHPETFWDSLEECQPDLLVLDIKMPQVSGLELCKVLRSHPDWQSIPVVFVSTVTDCSTQMGGIAAGGDEFISKQLEMDVIVRRILNRLARFTDSKKSPSWAKSSVL